MIKSMTGYGKAAVAAGGKTISVEVRSLNGKQLDLSVKMPSVYRRDEYEMRAVAAREMGRGKADVFVSVEEGSAPGAGGKIDAAVFGEYYRQIIEAARAAGMHTDGDQRAEVVLSGGIIPAILRLPDVMASESGDAPEAEREALMKAFGEALKALDDFRIAEGAVLVKDVLGRVSTIMELLAAVEPFEKVRVGIVRARILDNIARVGVAVDSNRLEQEMIFWIEKFDITEEKVRLTKHCDYFREVAGSDEEGVGRKLGFVAQEMGREINTLGSKANDADIQKLVVRMKDELEKIKEQLLNIL